MPRPKKATKPSDVLNNYDPQSLLGALNSFEASLGWEAFKDFLYYQAAVHGTMSNVYVQQSGKQYEACASGAKAEVLREVVDQFMDLLKDKIKGADGVVSSPPPEE